MNSRAKGSRLESKSIAWLRADGATLIFRGKGVRRQLRDDGTAQVDLIALYPLGWMRLVEVTVPSNRARARKRLQGIVRACSNGFTAEVQVWKPRATEPEREEVGR